MEQPSLSEVNKFFTLLRPYCIRLIDKPSKTSVAAFNAAISVVDDQVLQQFQEYLLIEISEVLSLQCARSKVIPEFVTDYVLCMQNILCRTEIRTWELFNRIITKIIMFLMKQGTDDKVDLSDELEMASVKCINEAMKRSTNSVLEKVYGDEFLTKLGCILFHLQQLFENEKCRELKILSMECLRSFITIFFESSLKNRLQDPLATFVPGISIALVNVASRSHGTVVVVTAIKTWTDLLVGVFDDELCLNSPATEISKVRESKLAIPAKDKEWMKMASERLNVLMPKIASLDGHSSWKVRKAVAEWAHSLLCRCKRSLSVSVSVWLDALISLSVDEYSSVKSFCENALKEFSCRLKPGDKELLEMVKDSLFSLVLQLPKIVKQSDETKILSILNQLYGYINILGPNVNEFTSSPIHLEKLSLAFMQLTELDVRNVHLVAETQGGDVAKKVTATHGFTKPSLQFLNFTEESVWQRIIKIWRLLGKYGNFYLLVDHMLDRFHQSSIYRKQSVLLLNEIIFGLSDSEVNSEHADDLYSTIRWVVDEYLEPSVWNLRTTRNNSDLDVANELNNQNVDKEMNLITHYNPNIRLEDSPLTLNSNVVLICLCLEGIAICAQAMKDEFKLLLRKVLYEVLEKCGSENSLVSDTAMKCLNSISASCNYNGVTGLIMGNVDYLLNSITLKLIHRSMDPKVPTVLHVSLQHGTQEMLNVAEDVIGEMLNCIEKLSGSKLVPYIHVLNSFCLAVLRWFPKKETNIDTCNGNERQTEGESVKEFILNFHYQKLASEEFEDNDPIPENLNIDDFKTMERETCDVSVDNNESVEINPAYVTLVAKVLERCGHLLPTSTPLVCYWVFNVINNAIRVLQGYDNVLLPSVHKVWPALSNRFIVENHAVVQAAFRTMCTLVDVCGDFVRARVLKELWPKMLALLNQESKKKNRSEYSSTFKLLQEVLLGVGAVAKKLDLDELELDNVASFAILFLNKNRPSVIQSAATKLLEELLVLNPDLMWLKLHDAEHGYSDTNDCVPKKIILDLQEKI